MSFVYPQFLWGLLALSIPIIIHLFNFRRTKKVYFSNTFFLRNVKEATTSKLKVKHLLILLARLLFITFLVLTFAQPFLPGKESADNGNNAEKMVYIYLDNSLSMSSELSSNARAIDQGVNYIEEILALYPRNTQYKFLTNEFGSFSRVPKSSDELSEMIAEAELSGVIRSADAILSKIQSDIEASSFGESGSTLADIYVISDFQRSTFGNPEVFTEDTTNNIKLVPINSGYESNIYVDSIYLENPFVLADEANALTVSLKNDGDEDVSDQIVRLLINDEQVASASLDINAAASGTVSFTLNFPLQQNNRCQIVFDDYPVTFDNEFYFSLNLGDKISVLEIKSEQLSLLDSTSVSKVYANRNIFDLQSYSVANLDYSLIESSDLVVLNEVGGGESNRSVIPYLQDYLAQGGHIMFIPPASGDISLLSQMTGNTSINAERIQRSDSVPTDNPPLANLDMANPFYDGMFEGEIENFVMPNAEKVLQHNLQGEALLNYRTGEPYLLMLNRRYIMSENASSDQLSFFATPLRDPMTSIHRHAIFVPVMYRLASRSKSMNNQLYYYVDNPVIALETASFYPDSIVEQGSGPARRYLYKLIREEEEVIPTQRMVSGRLLMEIPQGVIKAGFYELVRVEESASGEGSPEPLTSLSFNIDKLESLIDQYEVSDLEEMFDNAANVNIYEAENVEAFAGMIRSEQTNVALWKYALLLALFFLLTEILLIRFL